MPAYHPWLSDDSSDEGMMEEEYNGPQIAIKHASRKPLQKTEEVAEASDIDPEELVDQDLIRKLIDAYTEVRAEYDAEVEKHAERLCSAALEHPVKYEIWGGGQPKPMMLKPLATDLRGVQCGRLLDENGHTIQRVRVRRLEALKRTPPMRYWTHTNVNIKSDDDYTLSHVPYLADLSAEEGDQWCAELMEAFPDGVHGTKVGLMEGQFINDKILYETVKHVISVDERGRIDDAELRHVMHQVHAMFPDKGSVNMLVSRFPDLQARFAPGTVRRPIMQNEKGELLANFAPARLLNSFEALLCRRCMHYDCVHHGPDVEPPRGWRPRKRDEYEPGNEENKEPCSDDCYLNAPVQTTTSGMGVKTAVAKMFQSTFAGFLNLKDTSTASASTSPKAAINGPDLSMWGKADFNPPSKVPGWTLHEEASFNLIRVTCGEDYCRLTDVLGLLTGEPKKTCREVYEYARRTARLHLKKKKNDDAAEKPTGKQKSWEAWKIQDQNFRKTYANNGSKMNNQHMYVPCGHEGKCAEENGCQCAAVGNACTKFCGCANDDCRRRFPGCRCAPGNCRTKACNCYLASWECDPDVCTRCNCDKLGDTDEPICKNVSIQRGYQKKLIIAPSQVAGWGCFAGDNVEKNEFICEYTGEVISHGESERRGRICDKLKCSYLFRLNTSQDVDATRVGNLARFINHSTDPNCCARVMVVNGDHKIGIFAKRPIKRLEELFFNYAYNKSQQMEFVPLELSKHGVKPVQPKPKNDSSDQQRDRSGTPKKKLKAKLQQDDDGNTSHLMEKHKSRKCRAHSMEQLETQSRAQTPQASRVSKRRKHEDDWMTMILDDPDEPSTSNGSRKKRY